MGLCTRLRRVMVGAALCIAIGATGCQGKALTVDLEDGVLRRGHAIFQGQTCVRTDRYAIKAADMPLELCIRIGLRSGTLNWQILGPAGQHMQGAGDATQGQAYHINYCVEVEPGDWQFVLDMTQASGEYEIAWYEPGSAPPVTTYLSGANE